MPCVTGVEGVERLLATDDELIVDGERGLVVVAPKEAVTRFYESQHGFLAMGQKILTGDDLSQQVFQFRCVLHTVGGERLDQADGSLFHRCSCFF